MSSIVFDFDGLILDTETPEFRTWTREFESRGLTMPAGYWQTVIGRGAEQLIERPNELLARLAGVPIESIDLIQIRSSILLEIEREAVRPGVLRLMEDARCAKIQIGVASSSKHIWVDGYLKKLGLFHLFDCVVCAEDVERAKPFPDLYLEAARRLNASPAHSVALEDSPNGIEAAVRAGFFVFAVPNEVTASLDLSPANVILPTLEGVVAADLFDLKKVEQSLNVRL